MSTVELDIWVNGVPLIVLGGDFDFNQWLNGAPVEDQGDAVGVVSTTGGRRRVTIF